MHKRTSYMENITVLPTDIVIDIDNVLLKITVPKSCNYY